MYTIGILSALMLLIMQNLSHRIPFFSTLAASGMIRITVQKKPNAVKEIETLLKDLGIEIQNIQIQKSEKNKIKLELDVIYPKTLDKSVLFSTLAESDDVISIGE